MEEGIREGLRALAGERVLFAAPLSEYTSMGVGGAADALVFPETVAEAARVVAFLKAEGVPFIPVGNLTNLIVRDGGYRGVVLCLKGLRRLHVAGEGEDGLALTAEAGVPLSSLVAVGMEEGAAGLEFLAGIPGSVGGALRMNAGAFGREMKDIVASVSLLRFGGEVDHVPREELKFAYRRLFLAEGDVIVAGVFSLKRGERSRIRSRVEEIMTMRRERHPGGWGSAGSIFKNPPGAAAGRLIEEAGLKGLEVGGARVSEKHGNFIVNRGGARAADVLALMEIVRERVEAVTGIVLEAEVEVIGEEG